MNAVREAALHDPEPMVRQDGRDQPGVWLRSRSLLRGQLSALVVESDFSLRTLLQHALESPGFRVFTAADGDQALRAVPDGERLDLLLANLRLRHRLGHILAALLAEQHADLRVVLCSGYGIDDFLEHGLDTDSIVYLEKPFGLFSLLDKIMEAFLDERGKASNVAHACV